MRQPGRAEDTAGEAFWRFSLALYARPGVADALIAIQDRAAGDVNLILFGLWLGVSRGHRLTDDELAAAEAAIAPIAGMAVRPLRRLRRELKEATDADLLVLRRRVAGLEIAAERLAQHRLAAWSPGPAADGDRWEAACANVALILGEAVGSPEADTILKALALLIRRTERRD